MKLKFCISMKSRIWGILMALLALGAFVLLPNAASQQQFPRYTISVLGTLGGTFSEADGISARGALTGNSTPPGDSEVHGFLLENGVMTDLGTLGGQNGAVPEAEPEPNDRSQVVGVSETSTPDPNAENFCSFTAFFNSPNTCIPFIWQGGVMTPLPMLGGNNGTAWQINNRGQATGIAENATFDPACPTPELEAKPVIWEDGKIQELPTIDGDLDGATQSINDSGQVVGFSGNCTAGFPFTTFHAVLWQRDPSGWTATDLGNLGDSSLTLAFGINNRGQVVGQAGTACRNAGGCGLPGNAAFHAFLWQNGTMTDLGTLPGDVVSWAETINVKNQAVGTSFDAAGNMHPFIWQDGAMTDLNALIPSDSPWFLLEALGENDRGQIVGFALNILTGEVHGYLATPCDGNLVEGCGVNAGAAATQPRTPQRIVIPEEVRKLLNQRRGLWRRIPVVSQPKN